MKIAGTRGCITFDLENGYVIKAQGELLADGNFWAWSHTMKSWEPPHDKEPLSPSQIEEIINEVKNFTKETRYQVIFD